jgi:hypothetical protein
MKKTNIYKAIGIFILLLILNIANAQGGQKRDRKAIEEKVRSMRVGYITDALELTPEESQKFWPIYNQYETEKLALLKDRPTDNKVDTDAEGTAFINRYFDLKEKEISIEKKYIDKFKTAISVRKIAKLFMTEKKFRQEIMNKIVEKRKGG